jgi:hypothetical protein
VLFSLLGLLVVAGLVAGGARLFSSLGSSLSSAGSGAKSTAPAGPSTAQKEAMAKELGGTSFVSADGAASIVVSPTWTNFKLSADTGSPRVVTEGSWYLGSGDATLNDVISVVSEKIPSAMGMDTYLAASVVTAKRSLTDFAVVSQSRDHSAYGREVGIITFRMTIQGQPVSGVSYVVLGGGYATTVNVLSSPDRFDGVLSHEMPFISTVTAN